VDVAATALTSLGITVLALLFERPMHPYEMYQLLIQRRDDRLVKIRPGSLYHTVDRLERQELVAVLGTEREGNRPERTTYAVTEAGRAALTVRIREILATPVSEYPQFPVALAEAHNLDAGTVCELLGERVSRIDEDIRELEGMRQAVVAEDIPRVFWFGMDYLRAVAKAEADWLRGLIVEIESGELPWLTEELISKRNPQLAKD
jgi:DNA-binding PadR family transcriptional regulator